MIRDNRRGSNREKSDKFLPGQAARDLLSVGLSQCYVVNRRAVKTQIACHGRAMLVAPGIGASRCFDPEWPMKSCVHVGTECWASAY
jgi:hypothetical protein